MLAMENQNGMLINRASDTFGRPVGFTLFPLHLGEGQGEGKPQYSVTYAYDEFGRFASVSSSASLANLAVQYSYLPDTDIIAGYTSGDFTRTVSYEPARSLITAVENKFGNATISRYDYTNDELGRRTAIARSGSAFGDAPVTDNYGYNLRSEVTSARRTLSADPAQATPGFSHDYAYDPIGNRIVATNNLEAIAYTANSLNQYTAVNGTQPIYDDDGNLLSDGRFEYAWDGENRLIGITTREDLQPTVPRVKVTHCYDHQSRRIATEHATLTGTTWQPAEFRNFIYDGWNEVVEVITTPQSTTTNLYVWGLDLSSTSHDAAGVGGLLSATFENTTALYTYDANGNVSQLINLDGSLLAHYEYDPFGKTIVSDGVPRQSANSAMSSDFAQTNPFRFSTKHWDDATGLGYWGYRWYCPDVGRWLSRDPMYVGYNLYRFANNLPISRYDVRGLYTPPEEDPDKKAVCNHALEDFWAKNPQWKHARNWYENPPQGSGRKPCKLHYSCKCCFREKDELGGILLDRYRNQSEFEVIVCYNKTAEYSKITAHEVMHFFDECSKRFKCEGLHGQDYSDCLCRNHLCAEYRAYFITGECTDHDTCWNLIINRSRLDYWKWYKCDILTDDKPSDKDRIKEQLKSQCSLTEGMPPEPKL